MDKEKVPAPRPVLRLAAFVAFCAALVGGCAPPRSPDTDLPAPASAWNWTALVAEIKAFERRIGFADTANFSRFSADREAFYSCGYVARSYLPYSYEDPAIEWFDSVGEQQCRAWGASGDVVFSESEALGESVTPVTRSMLAAPLERFVYLVIHEDCHEQFRLPYGIEEALCNVIAFKAMVAFADERYRSMPREREAIQRYAREGAERAHLTVVLYDALARLYARHAPAGTPSFALLRHREKIFRRAERALGWATYSMNNVWIANVMTYSRHYPPLERMFDALGGDLLRMVTFFREVDAQKPSAAEIMTLHRLQNDSGADFLRAYEAAVVQAAQKALVRNVAATSAKEILSPPR